MPQIYDFEFFGVFDGFISINDSAIWKLNESILTFFNIKWNYWKLYESIWKLIESYWK